MSWQDPWPSWYREWWGIAVRVLVAVGGIAAAAFATLLAIFSATYKKTPAEWNFENLSLMMVGILIGIAALWVALRPTRRSWLVLSGSILVLFLQGLVI